MLLSHRSSPSGQHEECGLTRLRDTSYVHQVDFNMQEIDACRIYLHGQRYFSTLLITNMVLEPLIAIDQRHDIRGVEIPRVAAAGSTNGL
jgi:hypothetical protein